MGTDIYLGYDGMTDAEEKAQVTGFSIESGDVGYLRASIGMVTENRALRMLFPEPFWRAGKPLPYDFGANMAPMARIIKSYLKGADFDVCGRDLDQQTQRKVVEGILTGLAGGYVVEVPSEEKPSKAWAKSVIAFFKLGEKRQKEGRNPSVYISW